MTREQAEKEIRDTFTEVWADGIIKALEQEPKSEWEHDHEILRAYGEGADNALDKIRAEIAELHLIGYATVDGKREIASRAVIQIIDKYRTESEEV